jgi:hypothetical protein
VNATPLFDLEAYRAERNRRLERENEYLRDERFRLEQLLALALRTAVAGTSVSEGGLLHMLCEVAGTDPAKPAFVERRERAADEAQNEMVVRVLRKTAA